MKRHLTLGLLLVVLGADYAEASRKIAVVVHSDPPGAIIYDGDQYAGVAPLHLKYDVPRRWTACTPLKPLRARWVSGAETAAFDLQICPKEKTPRRFSLVRSNSVPGADTDALYAAQLIAAPRVVVQIPPLAGTGTAQVLRDEARQLKRWGAVTMLAGLTIQVLGRTALSSRNDFCAVGAHLVTCTTFKDPNMGAIYGGAFMVGGGMAMYFSGVMKESRAMKHAPDLVVGRRSIGLQKRVSF